MTYTGTSTFFREYIKHYFLNGGTTVDALRVAFEDLHIPQHSTILVKFSQLFTEKIVQVPNYNNNHYINSTMICEQHSHNNPNDLIFFIQITSKLQNNLCFTMLMQEQRI